MIRVLFIWNRKINADEFQHLHDAWMIHLGHLPYRDFWDNHTPLLHYLLAPILAVIGEGIPAVLIARVILSLSALGILWIVYRIVCILLDQELALITIVLLSISDIFLQKTIEVRPDQFLVLFWMGSLRMCLRTPQRFFIGGVLLGMGMLFSPKALLCVTAASVVFLFFRQASLLQKFKEVTLYVLGLLMPVAALGAFFFYKKELNELIQWTFIRNITYPDIRSSVFLLYPQNLVFFLLAFSGMIVWFLQKKILRHPVSLFLEVGVVLFCLVVFAMPGTFAQAGLMFVPIFSVAAAIALRASFQSSSKLFKTFTLIAGLIVPFVSILIARPFERTNQDQFAVMTWILQNTSENEKIFDGNTAYIFRPQAYYYGSLVDAIRYQIARGLIQASIPDNLRLNRCRVVIFDDRVADLPNPVQAFIRANYLPAEKQSIYLAGKNLGPENFSGKYATFRIEIPAIYRIETNPKEFRIDRMPYNQPLLLNAGSHRIEADEEIRFVKIVAMKEK